MCGSEEGGCVSAAFSPSRGRFRSVSLAGPLRLQILTRRSAKCNGDEMLRELRVQEKQMNGCSLRCPTPSPKEWILAPLGVCLADRKQSHVHIHFHADCWEKGTMIAVR